MHWVSVPLRAGCLPQPVGAEQELGVCLGLVQRGAISGQPGFH